MMFPNASNGALQAVGATISTVKRARDATAAITKEVGAKKRRLEQVSTIAKDVMINLLAGKLNYKVSDDEWEQLVQKTQTHPKFKKNFTFPSSTSIGWKKPKQTNRPSHLKIVALDCEMCVTQSLATKQRNSSALVRVTAIDGENIISKVITDLIVNQPEEGYQLVDPKTNIHGIRPDMIESSKISVAKAQKHLLKYISADTIVVGHSVHGDLASLRIDHQRVIDTALIFERMSGGTHRNTPGLKDLTQFLLNFEMPDGHDSSIDAQACMLAAKYATKFGCGKIIPARSVIMSTQPTAPAPIVVLPVAETSAVSTTSSIKIELPVATPVAVAQDIGRGAASRARSCRLRVHRIPKGINSHDLEQFFLRETKIVPVAVENVVFLNGKNMGSCHVTFSSPTHAGLAFDTIQSCAKGGKVDLDSIGRMQKTIAVQNPASGKVFNKIKVHMDKAV